MTEHMNFPVKTTLKTDMDMVDPAKLREDMDWVSASGSPGRVLASMIT